jgi:hypothetical protein
MIYGHESVFGDGILPHKLEGILVQFLERYLAFADNKSKLCELSNNRGDADAKSRSHFDLDTRYELPLILLPVVLVDGEEDLNLQI